MQRYELGWLNPAFKSPSDTNRHGSGHESPVASRGLCG